jgi:predicted component of type VI protein secretion system
MRACGVLLAVAVSAIVSGCGESDTAILPTTGPNQVVLKVPSMT